MEARNQEEIEAIAELATVEHVQGLLGSLHVPAVAIPKSYDIKGLDGYG